MIERGTTACSRPARLRWSSVARPTSGLAVGDACRAGSPSSSGATACVRVGALAGAAADRLAGQDAAARFVARHGLGEAQAGRLAQALEADEEERLVRLRAGRRSSRRTDSSSSGCLASVAVVPILARRVERVVAHVLEQRAAERVAAALADDGDVAAGAEAALGRREARVDAELGDRFHRRLQAELRAGRVQVAGARVPHVGAVDAVVVQVVLLVRLAVEAHRRPAAVAIAGRAGRERHQVGEVAAVDRQVLDFLRRDVDADLRGGQVEHRRGGADRDLLGAPPRRRARLRPSRSAPTPSTTSRVFGAKPASSICDGVGAGSEVGDGVVAVAVGDVGADRAGRLAGDGDGDAGQRAPGSGRAPCR